jgi:hypothetical protein
MNLLRRMRETRFPEPCLLESRTPGVVFQMTGSMRWKERRGRHSNIEAVVRSAVARQAQAIAIKQYADDIHNAEDAINADLAKSHRCNTRFYSNLTANVTLRLNQQARTNAMEYRHSVAHIERLRFLRKQLYSDPAMLLIDYLEKHPEQQEPPDIARFQRLAVNVTMGDRWWSRVLDALEKLSSNVHEQDGNLFVMDVLIRTLKAAAPELFEHHHLDGPPFHHGNSDSEMADNASACDISPRR